MRIDRDGVGEIGRRQGAGRSIVEGGSEDGRK